MLSLYVDLRKKSKARLYTMPRLRCGCVCERCGKRMYRDVGFMTDLDQNLPHGTALNDLVRGKRSDVRCRCGGNVTFTHCAERR